MRNSLNRWGANVNPGGPGFSEAQLAAENSPVAIVTLAQRAVQRRVKSPGERKTLKWELPRRLYERG